MRFSALVNNRSYSIARKEFITTRKDKGKGPKKGKKHAKRFLLENIGSRYGAVVIWGYMQCVRVEKGSTDSFMESMAVYPQC